MGRAEVPSRHYSQRPPASDQLDLGVDYEGGATLLTCDQMLKVARLKLLGYKAPPPSVSNNKVPDRSAGSDLLVISKAAQDSGCGTLLDSDSVAMETGQQLGGNTINAGRTGCM